VIAIIPARSGSKGLKNKNLKLINGIPLVAYPILAAKKAKLIKRIVLSTDSKKIAKIGKKYGAEVPFLRPKKLATDNSMVMDTYFYTIEKINKNEKSNINEFVVLSPTSPLRTANDIDKAIKIFKKKKADSLISVKAASYPIGWNNVIATNGKLKPLNSNLDVVDNRQKLKKTFINNGAVFIFKHSLLKKNRKYILKNTYPYVMSEKSSIDIDNELDFQIAKMLIEKNKK
jgi:N-acylneuraminate cytidylyltransferase/CMP-N,N'-diacetyllegionaminic acid synthase